MTRLSITSKMNLRMLVLLESISVFVLHRQTKLKITFILRPEKMIGRISGDASLKRCREAALLRILARGR